MNSFSFLHVGMYIQNSGLVIFVMFQGFRIREGIDLHGDGVGYIWEFCEERERLPSFLSCLDSMISSKRDIRFSQYICANVILCMCVFFQKLVMEMTKIRIATFASPHPNESVYTGINYKLVSDIIFDTFTSPTQKTSPSSQTMKFFETSLTMIRREFEEFRVG